MLDVKSPARRHEAGRDGRGVGSRAAGRPNVSVISICPDDSTIAIRGMVERAARWQGLGIELLFVCAARSTSHDAVVPIAGACLIYAPPDSTDAQLRSIGIAATSGDVVMFLDHTAVADDQWIERLSAGQPMRALLPGA